MHIAIKCNVIFYTAVCVCSLKVEQQNIHCYTRLDMGDVISSTKMHINKRLYGVV